MINKDFLKEVFVKKKSLMPLHMVKRVNVPRYDELSVTNIFPHLKNDAEFMQFFPTKLPKGRLPDRECKSSTNPNLTLDFFNILNTVHPNYLA